MLILLASLVVLGQSSGPTLDDSSSIRPADRPPVVVAGSDYGSVAIDSFDDSIPLPIPAAYEPTDAGDVLIAPASGDPFFLGFAKGSYYPPADERLDPQLLARLPSRWDDGRPTQETYAFVMFDKRITEARLAQLAELGARVIEFHPHYCMKVALPPVAIDAIGALDFVRWIGAPRDWQRMHPALERAFDALRDGDLAKVYIDVYDSDLCADSSWEAAGTVEYGGPDGVHQVDDPEYIPKRWSSNGWQQHALERAGVEIVEYVDSIRAFRGRISPVSLENLLALDFVQFIEPEFEETLAHDESMPMILADRSREFYDGGVDLAVAGQYDSGLWVAHPAFNGLYWWSSNLTGSTELTTEDDCGHGTHVAGTMLGSGAVEDSYEGLAERLGRGQGRRFFITKGYYGFGCTSGSASLATRLDTFRSAVVDASAIVTPRPHAINHSWGSLETPGGYFGTEADARTLDNYVVAYGQLQVFAAGNWGSGPNTVTVQGSAKNAFTVGGVRDYLFGAEDPGEMYADSSRGPTADNRWKPNVVAPATLIRSTSSLGAYADRSGTSMAAPHVTGLASQLVDHFPFLRHNPTTLAALLMATAMTKDDTLIQSPSSNPANHLNNYGAGRVEAWKAHGYANGTSSSFAGWSQSSTTYNSVDFTVNSGATRVVVCMVYHENAASAGASAALVNDYDMYIDAPPLQAGGNTGDYTAQQSPRDNTELRMVNNPVAGTWRVKVYPQSATSSVQVGVAVLVIYGDTTPDGTFSVTGSRSFAKPNQDVVITATATNPEYIASAVLFDSTSSGDLLQASTGTLMDGASASYLYNSSGGRDVLVGDIAAGDSRSVSWTTRWLAEGAKQFAVQARSDNWIDKSAAWNVTVDGTPPGLASNILSLSHPVNVWRNSSTLLFSWSAATDNLSGVDGYGLSLGSSPTLPSMIKDVEQFVLNYDYVLAPGANYVSIRTVDNCGNWSPTAVSGGPYLYDNTSPSTPGSLSSTTHPVGVQQCTTNVTMNWSTSFDSLSGVAGYVVAWNSSPSWIPIGSPTVAAGTTSLSLDIGSSSSARYFHIRAVDVAGNSSGTAHYGPILANAQSVVAYCTGKQNSAGCTPSIAGIHAPSKSAGTFRVACTQALNNKTGLLFWGFGSVATPFQGGFKCVIDPVVRTPAQLSGGSASGTDCTGAYYFAFTGAYMTANGLDVGQTAYAQWWMRDPQSPSTTGLSNALTFTVCQ